MAASAPCQDERATIGQFDDEEDRVFQRNAPFRQQCTIDLKGIHHALPALNARQGGPRIRHHTRRNRLALECNIRKCQAFARYIRGLKKICGLRRGPAAIAGNSGLAPIGSSEVLYAVFGESGPLRDGANTRTTLDHRAREGVLALVGLVSVIKETHRTQPPVTSVLNQATIARSWSAATPSVGRAVHSFVEKSPDVSSDESWSGACP